MTERLGPERLLVTLSLSKYQSRAITKVTQ
jgi:hypothetical protein